MTTSLHQSVADLAATVEILLGAVDNQNKALAAMGARLDVKTEASKARTERLVALEVRVAELEGTVATLTTMFNALRSAQVPADE